MSPGTLGTCSGEWGITKLDLVALNEVCQLGWRGQSDRGAGTLLKDSLQAAKQKHLQTVERQQENHNLTPYSCSSTAKLNVHINWN